MLTLKICRKGVASLALALPPLFLGADEASCAFLGDTLKPFASIRETYDSNHFRVKDSDQLESFLGDDQMSDFSTIFEVGTALHFDIKRQAADFLLKREFIRFSHYTEEDSERDEAKGKLSLSVLTKWTLKIDGTYLNAPEPRTEFRSIRLNERKAYNYGFLAGYALPLGLTLEGGYHRKKVSYSLPEFSSSEYDADIYTGSLSYRISPEARAYGMYEHEKRSFQDGRLIDGEFLRRDNKADSFRVGVETAFTGRTGISAYVGYLSRRHDEIPARDYSGAIAGVDATYALTYKTQLLLSGERQIYEETYSDWIYSISDTVGLGANYQVTEKVKATLFGRLIWKEFEEVPDVDAPDRSDFMNEITAAVEWAPIRRLTVGLDYSYSRRSSDVEDFDFTAHVVSAALAYRY